MRLTSYFLFSVLCATSLLVACGGGQLDGDADVGSQQPTASVTPNAQAASTGPALSPSRQPQTQQPPSADTLRALEEGASLNAEELARIEKTRVLSAPFDGPLLSGAPASVATQASPVGDGSALPLAATKAAANAIPTAVYRFFNTRTNAHFFTINVAERNRVATELPFLRDEGAAFYASTLPAEGLSPVHRFYNPQTGVHFYTISESERANTVAQLKQFVYEGIAYYASTVGGDGFTPLYRFFLPAQRFHFYTASRAERDNITALLPQYRYEGVGYYALGTDPSPPGPSGWWRPSLSDSWAMQLTGNLALLPPAAKVVDIDLFETPTATIASLKAQGHRVICYFSAGSSEDFRSDFSLLQPADKGKVLDGYPRERWLDTRSANVRNIMIARLNLAASKGCEGVDPDNVDGYANDTGFPLSAATQLDFNRWLAEQAHLRGMAVGLKNDVDQLAELAASFDFAVNEQCHEYSECGGYSAFVSRGKPVFSIEYEAKYKNNSGGARDAMCASAKAVGISTQVLPLLLDGSFRLTCP